MSWNHQGKSPSCKFGDNRHCIIIITIIITFIITIIIIIIIIIIYQIISQDNVIVVSRLYDWEPSRYSTILPSLAAIGTVLVEITCFSFSSDFAIPRD